MTAGVYRLENSVTGKVYIGMSVNMEQRKREHLHKRGSGDTKLRRAFSKYGRNKFSFVPLFVALDKVVTKDTVDMLVQAEKDLIAEHDAVRNGYNTRHAATGVGAFGKAWSERVKKRFESEEERMKCASNGEKNGMYGRSRKGERVGGAVTPMSGEKNGMFGRDWRVGKSASELEAHRRTCGRSGEANGCFGSTFDWITDGVNSKRNPKGVTVPEGWRKGFPEANMAGAREARKRSVRCVTTGQVYESASAAARDTGCDQGKITMVCSGKRKQTKGFVWEYNDAA